MSRIVLGNSYSNVTTPVAAGFAVDALAAGESAGAGLAAQFLVLAASANLANERVWTNGNGISSVDSGAGLAFTVAVNEAALNHNLLLNLAVGDVHSQYLKEKASLGLAAEVPEHKHSSAAEAGSLVPVLTVGATQTIIAAATAIAVTDRGVAQVNADASYTLTATPTIVDGADGRVIIIINVDTVDVITLQDETVLPGSNLRLAGGVNLALGPRDTVTLLFNTALGDYVEVARSNN